MADSKAEAPFVFEGSVKSMSSSNVSSVPADARTAVVQVDHVRHAPRALAGFAGKEITLRMAPTEKLSAGEKAVFFTGGLVFADHLAVQSMGHDPLVELEAKAALSGASPVVQKLRRRIDLANSVVSGKVTEVRPYAPSTLKAEATRGAATEAEPISEHTPFWHEAVIEVSGVHKGPKQKKVVLRFPTSTDVKWRKAPKFKKGQKGIWFLHSPSRARPTARATAAPGAEVYTALDPNDFHSSADSPLVESMLLSASPATATRSLAKTTASRKTKKKKSKSTARSPKKR